MHIFHTPTDAFPTVPSPHYVFPYYDAYPNQRIATLMHLDKIVARDRGLGFIWVATLQLMPS